VLTDVSGRGTTAKTIATGANGVMGEANASFSAEANGQSQISSIAAQLSLFPSDTGGTLAKAPGRLGDSSLIGCGCYANNESAAASTTGWGEPIMKLVLAKWAADRVESGSLPEWVAQEAMNYLKQRVNGHGGMILLDARGRFGIAHNTPRMAWAIWTTQKHDAGIDRNQ